MHFKLNSALGLLHLAIVGVAGSANAHAQIVIGKPSIALKSGESQELGNVFFTSNCRSLLKGTPTVEVLEGPPSVTVTLKEGLVKPRWSQCANKVPGGTLVITAKEIEDPSHSAITIRVNMKTKDGDRSFSQVLNISLLP